MGRTVQRSIVSIFLSFLITFCSRATAQYRFLIEAPEKERIKVFWQYCATHFISDEAPATITRFFAGADRVADSLHDHRLKAYAGYFSICSRILFSANYERHFAPGDYQSAINVFIKARKWALEAGHPDIAASAEHYMGQVYFKAARYRLAFEHLLKADEAMRELGYDHVPAISIYQYNLGSDYYRFEEFDKALNCFLEATRHPTYVPRNELNTLNSIGLIYARSKKYDKAMDYYRRTIDKARFYTDMPWLGIGCGNLGTVFLLRGELDSALYYHRINYTINSTRYSSNKRYVHAPEDAAKSALYMAAAFIRKRQEDSAAAYIRAGEHLAQKSITDAAERLEFHNRLLRAKIDLLKEQENYRQALLLAESLALVKDSLQQKLDSRILNRAVEKTEAERSLTTLQLMESRKNLAQVRFYLVMAALLLVIVLAGLFFYRYRIRRLRQEEAAEKEKNLLSAEKMRAEQSLQHARELMEAYLTTIKEKNNLIEALNSEMNTLKGNLTGTEDFSGIKNGIENLVSSTILTEEDWRHFRNLFEQVYPGFITRLKEKLPDLSPAETRLLILTKLNLSSREMASILGVSIDAIRKSRYRCRKKLNLDEETGLDAIIQHI